MENKQCYMCGRFSRYYTKGVKSFEQTKCGLCLESKSSVNIHESCQNFVLKARTDSRRGKLIKYYLSDLLTQLTEIRKLIEAENKGHDNKDM